MCSRVFGRGVQVISMYGYMCGDHVVDCGTHHAYLSVCKW